MNIDPSVIELIRVLLPWLLAFFATLIFIFLILFRKQLAPLLLRIRKFHLQGPALGVDVDFGKDDKPL